MISTTEDTKDTKNKKTLLNWIYNTIGRKVERDTVEIITQCSEETFRYGERLSGFLCGGDVVALYGELGSGKTVFAQGVCTGLGVVDYVTSPSFTLLQEYDGRLKVFHFDFYRLESEREVEELDVYSYFDAGGVSIVEWAERGEALLPEDRISVYFDRVLEDGCIAQDKRRLRFDGLQIKGLPGLMA
jgi:tRNA threonylcarbamoyladenosine biosynthesis protein TsaE